MTPTSLLQPPPDEHYRATILEVTENPYTPEPVLFDELTTPLERKLGDDTQATKTIQTITAQISNGLEKDRVVTITQGGQVPIGLNQRVGKGDQVILIKTYGGPELTAEYHVMDFYRLPTLGFIFIVFILLAVAFGRLKGLTSLLGLAASVGILLLYIAPRILAGDDPIMVTLIGAGFIATASLYLAHGFSRRTSVAVASTLITLSIAVALASLYTYTAKLFGTGTEDALTLQFGATTAINLQGLLLSGMIIGTLGVLDDITTAQTAVVDELSKANLTLSARELYHRALSVGREHIASLVNTLLLAYAGASLPVFLLFQMNSHLPLWVTLNSEAIAEEIVRTLVGSSALILAVPLATLLAVRFLRHKA